MNRASVLNPWTQPGVKYYSAVTLGAVAVVGIVMVQRTGEIVAIIPVLAGLIGGIGGFSPMLFVVTVVVCLNATGFTEPFTSQRLILDAILCMAVLAFVIAQYGLQSLLVNIYPLDSRNRTDAPPTKRFLWVFPIRSRIQRERRPPELVGTAEIAGLLWSLPIWAALACYLLIALPADGGALNFPPPIWKGIVLAWLFGVVWFVVFHVLEYVRYRQMSRGEAVVCLQDMVWNETRREQRRLNRWLAWQRRREPRKET